MKLGLFPKQKGGDGPHETSPTREFSPIYLIGFLIIMLFAIVLHFMPEGAEPEEDLVEPHVEPAPL